MSFALVLSVICCGVISVSAAPDYSDFCTVTLRLDFSSGSADCYGKLVGDSETESITDCTFTLTDSNGKVIKSWTNLSSSNRTLTFSRTVTGVTEGNKYTLSVTATAKRNGSSETVSDSVSATY